MGRKILKKSFTCGSPGIGSTEGLGVVKAGSKEVDSQVLGTKGSTRCGLLIHPSPSCKLRKTRPSNAYGRDIPNREPLSESRFEPRHPFMPLSMMRVLIDRGTPPDKYEPLSSQSISGERFIYLLLVL